MKSPSDSIVTLPPSVVVNVPARRSSARSGRPASAVAVEEVAGDRLLRVVQRRRAVGVVVDDERGVADRALAGGVQEVSLSAVGASLVRTTSMFRVTVLLVGFSPVWPSVTWKLTVRCVVSGLSLSFS